MITSQFCIINITLHNFRNNTFIRSLTTVFGVKGIHVTIQKKF